VAANDRARTEAAKRVEAERERAEAERERAEAERERVVANDRARSEAEKRAGAERERAEAQRERAEANDRATRFEAQMLELQQRLRVGIVHSDE
jgi:dTMP kinase